MKIQKFKLQQQNGLNPRKSNELADIIPLMACDAL